LGLDRAETGASALNNKYGADSDQYKNAQAAIDAYGKEGIDNDPMNIVQRVAMGLIAISLVALLWSSPDMILFAQPERGQIAAGTLRSTFSYENFVHEAGFARFTLAAIGLLILFIPYRRGERWALAALVILLLAYWLPVFIFGSLPNLGTWHAFRNWPPSRNSGVAMTQWYNFSFTALLLLGLVLTAPRFVRRKGA
jgi:hypothetical protein